jgi:hypothetical protein
MAFLGFLAGAALGGLAGYTLGAWTSPAWYWHPYYYAPNYYAPNYYPAPFYQPYYYPMYSTATGKNSINLSLMLGQQNSQVVAWEKICVSVEIVQSGATPRLN